MIYIAYIPLEHFDDVSIIENPQNLLSFLGLRHGVLGLQRSQFCPIRSD